MAHSQSELQVLTFAKNLLNYVFTITQKSPPPCNHLQSSRSIIKVEYFPFTCAISSMRNEIEEELPL